MRSTYPCLQPGAKSNSRRSPNPTSTLLTLLYFAHLTYPSHLQSFLSTAFYTTSPLTTLLPPVATAATTRPKRSSPCTGTGKPIARNKDQPGHQGAGGSSDRSPRRQSDLIATNDKQTKLLGTGFRASKRLTVGNIWIASGPLAALAYHVVALTGRNGRRVGETDGEPTQDIPRDWNHSLCHTRHLHYHLFLPSQMGPALPPITKTKRRFSRQAPFVVLVEKYSQEVRPQWILDEFAGYRLPWQLE